MRAHDVAGRFCEEPLRCSLSLALNALNVAAHTPTALLRWRALPSLDQGLHGASTNLARTSLTWRRFRLAIRPGRARAASRSGVVLSRIRSAARSKSVACRTRTLPWSHSYAPRLNAVERPLALARMRFKLRAPLCLSGPACFRYLHLLTAPVQRPRDRRDGQRRARYEQIAGTSTCPSCR